MSSIDGVNPEQQRYRCRRCQTAIDGNGSPCPGCGQKQRVPFRLPNGAMLHFDPFTEDKQIEGLRMLFDEAYRQNAG